MADPLVDPLGTSLRVSHQILHFDPLLHFDPITLRSDGFCFHFVVPPSIVGSSGSVLHFDPTAFASTLWYLRRL